MLSACAANLRTTPSLEVTAETRSVKGWFQSQGEWIAFPTKYVERYNPYIKSENYKCISIINDTGKPRLDFEKFHKKYVIIEGISVKYDELVDGVSVADKLLSKKYFKDQLVENFCLRDFVFVARNIRLGLP
jgi:hypothetical protein